MKEFVSNNLSENHLNLKKYSKGIVKVVKYLILLGFLYYIFTQVNFTQIVKSLKSVNLTFIILAFLLSLVNLFLQYKKWEVVCNGYLNIHSKKKVLYSLLFGFTAGILTPARIGEFIGRKTQLKENSIVNITAATILDKLFPMLILTSVGAIVFLYFCNYMSYISNTVFILGLTFVIIFSFVFAVMLYKRNLLGHDFINKIVRTITRKDYDYNLFNGINNQLITKLIGISLLFFMCYTFEFAILFTAFSVNLSFMFTFVICCVVMFSKSFIPQISFGDLGIREGAAVFFFTKVGVSAGIAISAALFLFLFNLLLPAAVGFIISHNKADV